MATMAGLQNDPGIPFYRHLAGLGAGSLSPTSHYAPLSLEGPPTPCLSRRGSAGSMVSLGDMANSGHTDTAHQMRLTLEQTLLLERQFSETPKASVLVRRGLAEAIGLPVQRVTDWFRDRIAKAKQQKKQEEVHTWRILESAGRRRVYDSSISFHGSFAPPSLAFPKNDPVILATPQQLRRTSPTPNILTAPSGSTRMSETSSRYTSPSEASYASLDRSIAFALAVAGAAAQAQSNPSRNFQGSPFDVSQMDSARHESCMLGIEGAESPWPVSAFSDYGSSVASSVAYTPTPATQLEDPFEYDHADLTFQSSPPSRGEPVCIQPPTDDYLSFADAVEMNTISNKFVLPTAPPLAIHRRKAAVIQGQSVLSTPQFRDPFSPIDICRLQTQNKSQDSELNNTQPTLAARRRRPKPVPLGSAFRRNSFMGPVPCVNESAVVRFSAAPMRRINSTGRISKVLPPRSPLHAQQLPETPDTGATVRPHTASSASSLRQFPLTFSPPSGMPLPPPGSSCTLASPSPPAIAQGRNESSQISPPPTPAQTIEVAPISTESTTVHHKFDGDLSAVPRSLSDMVNFATQEMEQAVMEDTTAFTYDFFAASPAGISL